MKTFKLTFDKIRITDDSLEFNEVFKVTGCRAMESKIRKGDCMFVLSISHEDIGDDNIIFTPNDFALLLATGQQDDPQIDQTYKIEK